MPNTPLRLFWLFLVLCSAACNQRPKFISFYYWRTTFAPDSTEQTTLKDNSVATLYVRYFDVNWPDTSSAPAPVAPVHFDSIPAGYTIIPVVFFRNRVFERSTPATLPALVDKIWALVRRINASAQTHPKEIQFDCDWTEKTKDNYFAFLRGYKQRSGDIISCTIRLHQIKYPDRTGIPPVDHGVLMFYNMGNIDAGPGSSIYDRSIAHRYTPSLRTYPLMLDLALPIFAWSLQIRDGKVIQLLDKMNARSFEKDTNFISTGPQGFSTRHACFRGGYYFQENDVIKIESVSRDGLLEIVSEVNRHTNHRIRDLIFFDLDRQNLEQYDKNLFKEILDHTD
ncbi:hypothetical protein [Puia dinghuensis]|uniref:Uncharacterized protein n=1 Tax=Puia dinghuensis TaxID=1792502 RepID=A0A8J2XQ78_9BACT|nr:hypothetical protein [Puia dinghuensis]GGA91068.1 hypothetical protein GCM10011511_12970 [Puia dinghuensis]